MKQFTILKLILILFCSWNIGSANATPKPTAKPTKKPTAKPTLMPKPTAKPTARNPPTSVPSSQPSAQPSTEPTSEPSGQPTAVPTQIPTSWPSSAARMSTGLDEGGLAGIIFTLLVFFGSFGFCIQQYSVHTKHSKEALLKGINGMDDVQYNMLHEENRQL